MKLLNSVVTNKPKRALQVYTIHHGIDRVKVKVPKDQVPAFEQAFNTASAAGAPLKMLMEVVEQHGGARYENV